MNIAIIGTGYVGLVSGARLAKVGHRVVCTSFSNELAGLCERVPGLDVETVRAGVHLERRLTPLEQTP